MDPYRIRAIAERLKRLPEGRRRRLRVVRGHLFRLEGVPELEGTGDNMQYSSQVQAVCDVGVRQIC